MKCDTITNSGARFNYLKHSNSLVVFYILFLKTITNEVRESESEGSVLGTVLKFVKLILSQVT